MSSTIEKTSPKVPDNLAAIIEREAKARGISPNDFVIEAFKAYAERPSRLTKNVIMASSTN